MIVGEHMLGEGVDAGEEGHATGCMLRHVNLGLHNSPGNIVECC